MENLLVPYSATSSLPGSRILVLAPHPDDEVFGCGGALALHAQQGATITIVIATDGAYHAGDDTDKVREERYAESRAAAAVLGCEAPRFLDLPDRGLNYGEGLINTILGLLEETQADLVYAPSLYEAHPDHRGLAMAAAEAVRRAGGSRLLAFYEVGRPLQPSHLVDITSVMARKAEAMACFPSQLLRQRYDQHVAALNRYRTYTLPAEVTAAEAFQVVSADDIARNAYALFGSEYQKQHAVGLSVTKEDLPLVSVLVRSMDRDALAQTLDSVALQTYSNIEVVVVNATGREHRPIGEWCGRFPLRLINPCKPLMRSAAANAALEAARGELLIFLDDDDRFLPGHIARLKETLDAKGTGTIAAYAGVSCVDAEGKQFHLYQRSFDKFAFSIENFIPIHAVLFRRTAIERGARFDEDQLYCEDWDFWLQVQDHGDFQLVPEVGAIYRVVKGEGSGLWGNWELARPAMLRVYRKRMPQWSDETLWRLIELTRFKPLYEKTHGELARANEKISTLERELAHAQSQFALAQEQKQAREEELTEIIAERDAELAAMRASSSWRITEPLRRLKTLFSGSRSDNN